MSKTDPQVRSGDKSSTIARKHREAPSLTAVTSGNAFLELGMQGPAVRELQRLLVLRGCLSQQKMNTGPGMFGLATLAAVKNFQRANRIPPIGGRPSGTAGSSTFEALYKTKPTNTTKNFAHAAHSNEAARLEEARRRAAAAVAMVRKNADTQLWNKLLPILKRLGISESSAKAALKELSTKLGSWMTAATTKIKSGLQRIQSLLTAAENVFASKAAKLLPKKTVDELLASIRKLKAALKKTHDRLDVMKANVNLWLKQQIDRLIGKPAAKTNVPSTSTPASQAQRPSTSSRTTPSGNKTGIKNTTGAQTPSPKNKTPPNTNKPSNNGTTPPKKSSSSGTPPSKEPPSQKPPSKEPPSRPPPKSLDELYALLSANARKSFDQQKQLHSAERFQQMEGAYKNADGTYDVTRANTFFEKRLMPDARFHNELRVLRESFHAKSKEVSTRLQNVINETDGTNRPKASLGDGSSEAALDWEIADGTPWKCGDGHYEKVDNAIKTLDSGIEALKKYREHITDSQVLSEVDAMIQSATRRVEAMRPAFDRWNQRVRTHPDIWNPDGTSRNKPGWP
jgi:hypothetical protein